MIANRLRTTKGFSLLDWLGARFWQTKKGVPRMDRSTPFFVQLQERFILRIVVNGQDQIELNV